MAKTPNIPGWNAFREAAERDLDRMWEELEKQVSVVQGKAILDQWLNKLKKT